MPTLVYGKKIKKSKKRIEDNNNLLESHKRDILDFDRYLELSDKHGDARRYKYLSRLPIMAEQMNVPFKEATKKDIEDLVLWIQRREDINDTTKKDYKILLKRFYKWLYGNKRYPEVIEDVTIRKDTNNKLPEDMLVEKDIEMLVDNANNLRDKAFISILWETGARIGEILDLTVGSIEDRQHGLKVVLKGKTGARRNPLIESVPHLKKYLEELHPERHNPKAPLWVNIGNTNPGKKMGYPTFRKILNDLKEKTDFNKPINPHIFRHSRATLLANYLTEAQMCQWFGWVQGSNMPSMYVHLSGKEIDGLYDRLHGIKDDTTAEELDIKPLNCPRCGEENPHKASYCYRCGMAMTIESSMKIEDTTTKLSEGFVQLVKENPQLLTLLEEELKRINESYHDRKN